MEQVTLSLLTSWENFYVIIGSSAAALTGLQFVVMVLSAEANTLGNGTSVGAFGTPTIVHFCAVLLISAILSAPWSALTGVGLMLSACGVREYGMVLFFFCRFFFRPAGRKKNLQRVKSVVCVRPNYSNFGIQ